MLIAATVLLTECRKEEVPLAPKIAGLLGTWQLVEPDSSYAVTLLIELDTANPPHDITPFLASGKSAVNAYTVRLFAAVDGMMSAENLGSTKLAGLPAATAFEQNYFTNLRAVVRFELLSENRLRLYHGGNLPHVMEYKKIN